MQKNADLEKIIVLNVMKRTIIVKNVKMITIFLIVNSNVVMKKILGKVI